KGTLHTNNTDSNSRLCMASAVAGYRTSLGSDGPPCCYEDIDHAELILIIGANMAEAHPVLFDRIRAARKSGNGPYLVTIDPRRTPTARDSNLHIAIAPGADIALLNALGRLLADNGHANRQFIDNHTSGFDDYLAYLKSGDLDEWSSACGIDRDV